MSKLINFLKREDVKQFIKENIGADVNRIVLNPPPQYKEQIKAIASQILARQKAIGKLDSWAQNFDLVMPPPLSIEQASSQITCDYKKSLVSGHQLLDLTGGMGVDFLALSEVFEKSTYVEQVQDICQVFEHNAKVLKSKANVINDEASSFLSKLDASSKSTIYLDPARRDEHKGKVFKIEDCTPNLKELLPILKLKANKVLVKYSPLLDIHAILQNISGVKEVHVVSVKNECKELLLLIDFDFSEEPAIHCINLESSHDTYSFKLEEERLTKSMFSDLQHYLLEPNSSIMKAGAFKKVGSDFNVSKLAEHTHLYTTDTLLKDFPGRVFKVIAEVDKKNIKQFAFKGCINVITRNYPLKASELKKKWKLKDGGNYFLIAFKDKAEKPRQIIAQRADSLG
ncbi:THUMP-like domain-containing protein [Ekhidna sp. To15]|uniref:THUMP-like domain-containing protein n=1 Tax=Ekhidna sp. To15 TaxID=3395267 RepID=UPI003F51F937